MIVFASSQTLSESRPLNARWLLVSSRSQTWHQLLVNYGTLVPNTHRHPAGFSLDRPLCSGSAPEQEAGTKHSCPVVLKQVTSDSAHHFVLIGAK